MFKDIEGYERLYKISDCNEGVIRGNKQLKHAKNGNGYLFVSLCKNGKKKQKLISRLVAETFIPNPNNYPVVMHLDNNKENNNVTNLKWGTISENTKQAYRDGLMVSPFTKNPPLWMKGKFGKNNPRAKGVLQYSKDGILIKQWDSIMDAERELGISNTQISSCCMGRKWNKSAGGFIWKYS